VRAKVPVSLYPVSVTSLFAVPLKFPEFFNKQHIRLNRCERRKPFPGRFQEPDINEGFSLPLLLLSNH